MWIKKYSLFEEAESTISVGAPAAEATPQEPSAPVEESFTDSEVDWQDLSEDADESSEDWSGEEPPATIDEPSAQPTAPETTPAVETPAAEPEVIQPEVVAPEVQPQQQLTPEQVREAENAYVTQLANLYRFDEETALKLQTEPENVLPALAAKVHLDVMKTVLGQVRSLLPQLMQTQAQANEREVGAKSQFFGAWPELKGFESQVLEVGKMYRQMNPTAPADEAIKRIGETAMAALGLQRKQVDTTASSVQTAPAYRPSAPGRVTAPASSPTEWDELLVEDD
jgi:hypothetical protein